MSWRLFMLVIALTMGAISTMFTLSWAAVELNQAWHDPAWGFTHPSEVELVIQETGR